MREITELRKGWNMTAIDAQTNEKYENTVVELPFIHSASAFSAVVFDNSFIAAELIEGETVYAEIDRISGNAKVFSGTTLLGEHRGTSSAFRVKMTDSAVPGEKYNIKIAVEPSARPDGNFVLGKVRIISVNRSHFDLDDCAGQGITVKTVINDDKAQVHVSAKVTNPNNYDVVSFAVENADGDIIAIKTEKPTIAETVIDIPSPELWSGQHDAYLYTLKAALVRDTAVLDNFDIRFGLRKFEISEDKFFRINGLKLPLNGISLADCTHMRTDRVLLDMIDANAVTTDSFPVKTDILSECDETGTLFWFDLPFTGDSSDLEDLRHFLIQNRNHPSFAFICCSEEADEEYIKKFTEICSENAPDIITAVKCDINNASSLPDSLPDIAAITVNGEDEDDNFTAIKSRFDEIKQVHPETAFALFAHAPEVDESKHSEAALCIWHEKLWNTFCRDKTVIGFFAGMLTDSQSRGSSGLVTEDREYIRDAFWFYKSQFSAMGFVKICAAELTTVNKRKTDIKCYTNTPPVKLTLNGKSKKKYIGEEKFNGVYTFKKVKIRKGRPNTVEISAGDLSDCTEIKYEKRR